MTDYGGWEYAKNFFFRGKLDRSDIETNHPGERPIWENIKLVKDAGFKITKINGIIYIPHILI